MCHHGEQCATLTSPSLCTITILSLSLQPVAVAWGTFYPQNNPGNVSIVTVNMLGELRATHVLAALLDHLRGKVAYLGSYLQGF